MSIKRYAIYVAWCHEQLMRHTVLKSRIRNTVLWHLLFHQSFRSGNTFWVIIVSTAASSFHRKDNIHFLCQLHSFLSEWGLVWVQNWDSEQHTPFSCGLLGLRHDPIYLSLSASLTPKIYLLCFSGKLLIIFSLIYHSTRWYRHILCKNDSC